LGRGVASRRGERGPIKRKLEWTSQVVDITGTKTHLFF
jgi:hypothetical protein